MSVDVQALERLEAEGETPKSKNEEAAAGGGAMGALERMLAAGGRGSHD